MFFQTEEIEKLDILINLEQEKKQEKNLLYQNYLYEQEQMQNHLATIQEEMQGAKTQFDEQEVNFLEIK